MNNQVLHKKLLNIYLKIQLNIQLGQARTVFFAVLFFNHTFFSEIIS